MKSFDEYIKPYKNCALINSGAISHNLRELKRFIPEGVLTLAVVKANAYGHGSVAVSRHIENEVDYFAVGDIYEAIELRDAGIKKPILILSYTLPQLYEKLVEYDVTATIYNVDEARLLSEVAEKMKKSAKIHIAVDTGMGRIGFMPDDDGADKAKAISLLPSINLEGLFSHYANADSSDKTSMNRQTALFDRFIALLSNRGVEIPIKHICNTAGTFDSAQKYNMCRLGISLYGLYPSEEVGADKAQIIPAMQVISRVIHVKDVPAGFTVGYGHDYISPGTRTIATVGFGYADGYNRCLGGVGYVLINGKKAPVVGRVCMDQIMVDVTGIENVTAGTVATILGENGDEKITAEEFAKMANSLSYEVVCTFMPRVKRVYVE